MNIEKLQQLIKQKDILEAEIQGKFFFKSSRKNFLFLLNYFTNLLF